MSVPPEPRRRRQSRLIAFLRIAGAAAFVLAVVGVCVPGNAGRSAALLAIGVLVLAPVVRTGWLAVRWWRRGDRGFALVAASVLAVVATGALVAGV